MRNDDFPEKITIQIFILVQNSIDKLAVLQYCKIIILPGVSIKFKQIYIQNFGDIRALN